MSLYVKKYQRNHFFNFFPIIAMGIIGYSCPIRLVPTYILPVRDTIRLVPTYILPAIENNLNFIKRTKIKLIVCLSKQTKDKHRSRRIVKFKGSDFQFFTCYLHKKEDFWKSFRPIAD